MKQSERHRARAAECLRLAEAADQPGRRVTLVNMAECWLALAVRAELAEEEQCADG